MKHKLFTISVLFLFLAGLISVNAQPGKEIKDGPKKMLEQLKLTNEQQAKFDQYHYENQKQAIELRAEIEKNRLEIRRLLDNSKLDEDKIITLVKTNGNLENSLKESRIKMMFNIYNILDDTQKEIWKDNLKNFGDRRPDIMTGKRHMMGDRPPAMDRMRPPMQWEPESDND